jgi:hypothetical protein
VHDSLDLLGENSMKTYITCPLLAALLVVPTFAQDKYTFGLSGSVVNPMIDVKKLGGLGLGLSALGEARFTDLVSSRLRAEYMLLDAKEDEFGRQPMGPFTWSRKSKLHGAFADFLYGRRQDDGVYFLAGVGYLWLGVDCGAYRGGMLMADPATSRRLDLDGLAYSIGLGVCGKHVGLEAKVTKINSNGPSSFDVEFYQTFLSNLVFGQWSFIYRF